MKPEVALVNMPFYGFDRPSLGLSLLKASLKKRNIPCDIHYVNFWFAREVGFDLYSRMDLLPSNDLTGEWVFSAALWGRDEERDKAYLEQVVRGGCPHHRDGGAAKEWPVLPGWKKSSAITIEEILSCRREVEPFLARCVSDIDWEKYRVVGFSSTFQQQLAALALASRLKQRFPHLLIVFGGSNCEGRMGAALFKAFPFIDALCSGEGDMAFPDFVESVLSRGASPKRHHLLVRREDPGPQLLGDREAVAPKIMDLDSLPYPDFDDFFKEHLRFSPPRDENFRLLIETSRGCWWGEVSHCTFCGLNGSTMAFRQKSPERVLDELCWLLKTYGQFTRFVSAVDNIMPTEYFTSVLPSLEKLNLDLELFYETKSNLKKGQVQQCSRAGIKLIQPGIESLNSAILQLMGKGATLLQNVQLLKWCRQFGIHPCWNYLVGLVGESPEHYVSQADLIDTICHLPPPSGGCLTRVRFDRFSPYFEQADRFGIRNLRPYPSYEYVYPFLPPDVLRDVAYFFVGEFEGQDGIDDYVAPLSEAVRQWHSNYENYALFSGPLGDQRLFICDLRRNAASPIVTLNGTEKIVYEECDSICTKARLIGRLSELGHHLAEEELEGVVQSLTEQKLLLVEGDKYLSLGIPLGYEYMPNKQVFDFCMAVIEELAQPVGQQE